MYLLIYLSSGVDLIHIIIRPIVSLHSIRINFPSAIMHILPAPKLSSGVVGVLDLVRNLHVHHIVDIRISHFGFWFVSAHWRLGLGCHVFCETSHERTIRMFRAGLVYCQGLVV